MTTTCIQPNLQQKSSKKPMKITHVMREVACSFERERAERGRVKEAEFERGEDDDQDLDIKG